MADRAEMEELARRVNNWGRWGPDDRVGTLNLVTDDVRRRAASCVSSGRAFSLSLPLSTVEGIQLGFIPGRINPLRTMIQVNGPLGADGTAANDDVVVMALQAATHWDGLAHISFGGRLYNGVPASSVTAEGATVLGIHHIRSLVSRGVLLDVARALGVDTLEGGYPIMPTDLDAACALGRVEVAPGDVVLVRTGQMAHLRRGDKMGYAAPSPGLTADTAVWFHEHDVAAVATDTMVFDVYPPVHPDVFLPAHRLHLVEMGMTQGQNFVLDALADDCAADGVYVFLLEASPQPFTNALGSPVNPVAVK